MSYTEKNNEELIIARTKLNEAFDCAYSVGDWELCETISERIKAISDEQISRIKED